MVAPHIGNFQADANVNGRTIHIQLISGWLQMSLAFDNPLSKHRIA